jgi:RNA polymerase-binding transcription factor DksA
MKCIECGKEIPIMRAAVGCTCKECTKKREEEIKKLAEKKGSK